MVDLSIKIHDLELKNPVTTASGTFGYGEEFTDFFDPGLLGGIFIKGLTLKNRDGNPYPRMAETASGMLNAVGAVLTFIASIALLVGGVGVMNVMLASVTQRTREIGLRMALGARKRDITLQFLTEATWLTGLGGAIGVGIALAIVTLIRQATPVPAIAPAWTIAVGLGLSLSVGVFFGLYPATRASRLDPIESLRHE